MEISPAVDLSGRNPDIRALGDDHQQHFLGNHLLPALDRPVSLAAYARQDADEQSLG